jgi:protease-4
MPVVASINSLAASGGFYLAMAADPVYAKPNSTIGNVGVWGFAPESIGVNEQVLASGPFKLTASNNDAFLLEIEAIKQEFLQTVQNSRGDRLDISTTDLSQGLAYTGRFALDFGLIDQLGSQSDAVDKAAELAGIENHEVIDLQEVLLDDLYGDDAASVRPGWLNTAPDTEEGAAAAAQPWFLAPWLGAENPLTGLRTLPPGVYLLFDVRIGGSR